MGELVEVNHKMSDGLLIADCFKCMEAYTQLMEVTKESE